MRPKRLLLPAMLAALSVSATARAELGGAAASVAHDQAQLGARRLSASHGLYQRHDLTRVNGGAVREFSADGRVFAVTWSGPGRPDLRTLLGPYFARYQAANCAGSGRTMHALRHPPQVADTDLRIATGGHMGFFHGIAFIPSLAPAGFATGDLAVAR